MSDQQTRQAKPEQPRAPGLPEANAEGEVGEGLKLQDGLLWIQKFEEQTPL